MSVHRGSTTAIKYNGLWNQGSTCYLNSVLQVLFMTKEFREAIERQHCEGTPLDCSLKNLFEDLKNSDGLTYKITQALGISPVYKQADAAECFENILNRVTAPGASQIFQGTLTLTNTCCDCGGWTSTDDLFWMLPLEMKDYFEDYKVLEGIQAFFSESTLSEDNQLYCEICCKKSNAVLQQKMKHHPDVLTLLLKRFRYDCRLEEYKKIRCRVQIPGKLQIPPHGEQSQHYELYAYVEHFGDLKCGHYTATIKSQDNNQWYTFDDTKVAQWNSSRFQRYQEETSLGGYMLFYRKVGDSHPLTKQNSESIKSERAEQCRQGEESREEQKSEEAAALTQLNVDTQQSEKEEETKDAKRQQKATVAMLKAEKWVKTDEPTQNTTKPDIFRNRFEHEGHIDTSVIQRDRDKDVTNETLTNTVEGTLRTTSQTLLCDNKNQWNDRDGDRKTEPSGPNERFDPINNEQEEAAVTNFTAEKQVKKDEPKQNLTKYDLCKNRFEQGCSHRNTSVIQRDRDKHVTHETLTNSLKGTQRSTNLSLLYDNKNQRNDREEGQKDESFYLNQRADQTYYKQEESGRAGQHNKEVREYEIKETEKESFSGINLSGKSGGKPKQYVPIFGNWYEICTEISEGVEKTYILLSTKILSSGENGESQYRSNFHTESKFSVGDYQGYSPSEQTRRGMVQESDHKEMQPRGQTVSHNNGIKGRQETDVCPTCGQKSLLPSAKTQQQGNSPGANQQYRTEHYSMRGPHTPLFTSSLSWSHLST